MNKQTENKLLKIVRTNYEEIAEKFSETRKKFLWPELISLTQDIKNGDRILDVGCGSGRLLRVFDNRKVYYLGVDACSRLVDIAKSNYPDFEFLTADILKLEPIKELKFNYIFAIAVLQHVPGSKLQIQALEQMKTEMLEDGRIIIVVWNMWSQKKFRKLLFKYFLLKIIGQNKMDWGDVLFYGFKNRINESGSQRYYHAFTRRQLKKLARRAGLKVEKLYKDKYNYYLVLTK